MDIFNKVDSDLEKVMVNYATSHGIEDVLQLANIRFVIPPIKTGADYSTNASMIFAKLLHTNPAICAGELGELISKIPYIKQVDVLGGYINILFADDLWKDFLTGILVQGENFGNGTSDRKVLLEFISANPTGPLHVGHCRGAILGLALSKIMQKAGYSVTKEYYVNDYGVQIATLLKSVQFRYEQQFGLHINEKVPEGCYPGSYLVDCAKDLAEKYKDKFLNFSQEDFYTQLKSEVVDAMMEIIKSDLKLLGLEFDSFVSETKIVEDGKIESAINYLKTKFQTVENENGTKEKLCYVYEGCLPRPQGGSASMDDEEESNYSELPQTLFRSTLFGDDKDRVIVRANGQTTYFASDIAYHKDKVDRGYTDLVNIFGADHSGYVKRLSSAVEAISDGHAKVHVLLCQMVSLENNGEPFKMSKRKGTFVLLSDVAKEVDVDELKLFMLSKSADTQMTFDLVKVKEKSKENLVYYIQYAHARTNSLLKKYAETFGTEYQFSPEDLNGLIETCPKAIKEIIVFMAKFYGVVRTSAEKQAPNLIVDYLKTLASMFHSLWGENFKLIDKNDQLHTASMMAFVTCVKTVIASALQCLGITPKEQLNNE